MKDIMKANMTTEYLYHKDKKLNVKIWHSKTWRCVNSETMNNRKNRIKNNYFLRDLLTKAVIDQNESYDSCRLIFFNQGEGK